MDKAEVIRSSLRCFACGLIGVLPIVGTPMAVRAIMAYFKVVAGNGDRWNPAQRYLIWGSILGGIGLLLSLGVLIFIGAAVFLNSVER